MSENNWKLVVHCVDQPLRSYFRSFSRTWQIVQITVPSTVRDFVEINRIEIDGQNVILSPLPALVFSEVAKPLDITWPIALAGRSLWVEFSEPIEKLRVSWRELHAEKPAEQLKLYDQRLGGAVLEPVGVGDRFNRRKR